MKKAHSLSQFLAIGFATGAVVLSSAMPVQAQSTSNLQIDLSGLTASEPTSLKHHALPANTPAAKTRHGETSNMQNANSARRTGEPGTRYPGDLSNQGGPVVEYAQSHEVYFALPGCTTPACWGNPRDFLANLGQSEFIHVVDQYTGNRADNRYTVSGTDFTANGLPTPSPTAPLTDAFLASVAHEAAALIGQSGYGHIFHLYLPPGQDVCFTATDGVCYSPDVPSTFFFCAYHSSADFTDGTHVVYTVEPYQNVGGCSVEPGTPNGQLVDSTASVLSHETFETITDPDGTAWWNNGGNLSLNGQEIGDECEYFEVIGPNAYFDVPAFRIGGKRYAVQREYNNHRHGCTEEP